MFFNFHNQLVKAELRIAAIEQDICFDKYAEPCTFCGKCCNWESDE